MFILVYVQHLTADSNGFTPTGGGDGHIGHISAAVLSYLDINPESTSYM